MKPSEKLKQIRKKVESTLGDNKDFDFLLTEIPAQIEKRTRLGKGVSESGELEKIKPLSEGYVLARKGYKAGEVRFIAVKKLTVKQSKALNKRIIKKNQSSKGVFTSLKGGYGKLKKVRFKAKGLPVMSELTNPKKSNLTLTGQMLSAIRGIRNGTKFIFTFAGTRDDGKTNSQIAQYARENGRPFFSLSKSEQNGLQRKISKIIKESIKKLFDN